MNIKPNKLFYYLIVVIGLVTSACSGSENDYPNDFPEKWLLLSKSGNDMVIEEGSWGFDQISLKNENGKLTEVSISSGGGVEQYVILKVSLYEDKYYTFSFDEAYNPLNLEAIRFYWEDQVQGVGVWQTSSDQTYVASGSKGNFQTITYLEDGGEADISDQGVISGENSITEKMIYLGSSAFEGSILLKFKRPGGGVLEFASDDFSEDVSSFYNLQSTDEGLPIVNDIEGALNQLFDITFHFEERENDNSGETEKVPIFDRLTGKESSDASILNHFRELPLSAFNQTTEGLSKSDKKKLLSGETCETWSMQVGNSMLNLFSKLGDSNVKIAAYPSIKGDLLAVATSNEQASFITFWEKVDAQWTEVESGEVLPDIDDQDYFDVATGKGVPKTYAMNEKREIISSPNTRMNPDYEKLPVKYNVLLSWSGGSFSKKRVKVDS